MITVRQSSAALDYVSNRTGCVLAGLPDARLCIRSVQMLGEAAGVMPNCKQDSCIIDIPKSSG